MLFIIIFLLMIFYCFYWFYKEDESFSLSLLGGITFGLIIGFCLNLPIALIASVALPTEEYSYNFNIYSFEDNHSTYISRYSSHEELKYYFIRQSDYGQKVGYIPSEKSFIVYDDEKNPNIKVIKKRYTKNFISKALFMEGQTATTVRYIITIPKGSVKEVFNVDLE